MEDNKNFMIAIALTMAILLGYTYFYDAPRQKAIEEARQEQLITEAEQKGEELPDIDSEVDISEMNPVDLSEMNSKVSQESKLDRQEVLTSRSGVILINSPRLKGSISLKGSRFDDLTLSGYKEDLETDSLDVALLSPEGSKDAYYVDYGWFTDGALRPDKNTVWSADQNTLDAGGNVTLTWNNNAGLLFTKIIELDDDYMFTITLKVENTTNELVRLTHYGRVDKKGRPEGTEFFISDEGPMWSVDGGWEMFKYSKLDDEDLDNDFCKKRKDQKIKCLATSTNGGWVGISDKYWLVALIPDQKKDFTAEIYRRDETTEKFFAKYYHKDWTVLTAGSQHEETFRLFAGAKEAPILDYYTDVMGIKELNYAIDWGMFHFLTKPIFYLLEILYAFAGNFGIAILLLTAIVKLALFPLANKGYKSMNKMKVLQPKMQALKEKYGDDKTKMQQATMELYKKEKVNPVSGCLPMFLQFPVFFALYKVLYVTIDMRHAPFFGWIKDLSGPDTMLVSNLFGLLPWEPTGFLALGILPVFMGFTMWLQMQMNPSSGDPMQRKIMLFMPIVFTFMLAQFSVGLVIYWTCSNILGILQQWILMRRADPVPATDKA